MIISMQFHFPVTTDANIKKFKIKEQRERILYGQMRKN